MQNADLELIEFDFIESGRKKTALHGVVTNDENERFDDGDRMLTSNIEEVHIIDGDGPFVKTCSGTVYRITNITNDDIITMTRRCKYHIKVIVNGKEQ